MVSAGSGAPVIVSHIVHGFALIAPTVLAKGQLPEVQRQLFLAVDER